MQAVLDFLPQPYVAQHGFDAGGDLLPIFDSMLAQGKLQILYDRERERIRLLENHADPAAQFDHIGVRGQYVEVIEADASRQSAPGDNIGQAIERGEEARFPQPDGPTRAVMHSLLIESVTS